MKEFPIIPCNLCGSQENLQRQAMKVMLQCWDKQFPGRLESIFSSLQNIAPSQLADARLFDFAGLALKAAEQGGNDAESVNQGLDILEM